MTYKRSIEMHNLPGFMSDNDQYMQHLKTCCRHLEKINGICVEHVIFQECSPCLGWRITGPEPLDIF
jgi:hypothetical protein